MDYRFTPDAETHLRRRIVRRGIPMLLVAAFLGVAISMVRSESAAGFWLTVPLLSLALTAALIASYRRESRRLRSFVLRVTPEWIEREVEGMQPLRVRRDEIARITRSPDGTVYLLGEQDRKLLVIPSDLTPSEALLDELPSFRAIEPEDAPRARRWPQLVPWLCIGAFAVVALSRNRALVIVVGTALFATLITCIVLLWRNKALDKRLRRLSLLGLLPAIAILARVLGALTDSLD